MPSAAPRISVALATYDGEGYLGAQLESIGRQTRLPSELVVCDDGSTDRTLAILEAFAGTAPFPVHVTRNPARLDFAANLLKAASLCRGDYVAFCDQDDVWLEGKLERTLRSLADPAILLSVHAAELVDEDLRPLGRRIPDVRREGPRQTIATPAFELWHQSFAMTVRRDFFERLWRAWPMEEYVASCRRHGVLPAHDLVLFAAAYHPEESRIAYLDEVLVLHRSHGSNRTASAAVLARTPAGRFRRYFGGLLSAGGAEYERLAAAHASAAALVDHLADRLQAAACPMLGRLARYYAVRGQGLQLRARLYEGDTLLGRLRDYGALWRRGHYHSAADGRFGLRSAIKDLPACLGLGHGFGGGRDRSRPEGR